MPQRPSHRRSFLLVLIIRWIRREVARCGFARSGLATGHTPRRQFGDSARTDPRDPRTAGCLESLPRAGAEASRSKDRRGIAKGRLVRRQRLGHHRMVRQPGLHPGERSAPGSPGGRRHAAGGREEVHRPAAVAAVGRAGCAVRWPGAGGSGACRMALLGPGHVPAGPVVAVASTGAWRVRPMRCYAR